MEFVAGLTTETMKELISDWAAAVLKIHNLEFSDEGTCSTILSDTLRLDFEIDESSGEVFLYGPLSPQPNIAATENLVALLDYNYRVHRDANYRFVYDSEASEFLLLGTLPPGVEKIEELDAVVIRFAQSLEHFCNKLTESEALAREEARKQSVTPDRFV